MRLRLFLAPILLTAACAPAVPRSPAPMAAYDVIIANGKIVDGSGNPWYYGDVGVRGDRIVFVGPKGSLAREQARERVDAAGMVVAPGFIDIQSHSWGALLTGDGRVIGKVTQGVTSEILGESTTPAPLNASAAENYGVKIADTSAEAQLYSRFAGPRGFDAWLTAMERHGNSVNAGSYLGASTVRAYAKAQTPGVPTAAELDTMRMVVRNAMMDGAFGISTALIYPPGSYAGTEELAEMARAMAPYGGSYITHIRDEGDRLLEAADEALYIGRYGDVPVVIYHLKASGGRANWPKARLVVAKIDSARRAGLDVIATMYPYAASGNNLSASIPDWAAADGRLLDNLRDSVARARIVREMIAAEEADGDPFDGPESRMVIGLDAQEYKRFDGLRLKQIGDSLGRHWAETLVDIVIAEEDDVSQITFGMSEQNVAMQIAQPWVIIGTDAGGRDPATARGFTHPRAYGTYPRILGKYVRDEGVLRLEDAVRKMSWAVAQSLGIRDRGLVKEGSFADIIIFDPATIADRATFTQPHQLSVGVRDVWVNGVRVLNNGMHTGAKPGRALRGPGWRRPL
ncbi:MAG TPA: D-aminoacylase [Gemmatimonadaceae bacterium]|nr:D-aminoacylase [Gemmatimonadaceae bacterium]